MTSTPVRSFRWLRFFLVALPFFALDQFFKWLTVTRLEMGQSWEPIPAIADVIRVTRSFNTGAAFGMFPAGSNLFLALAFVVAGIFVYLYPRLPDYASLSRIAISMISAGALSNAIDRVRFDHVVDYVHVQIGTISNVSNFADHIIFVGVVLLMIDLWRIERIEAQHTQQESGDAPEAGEDIAQADLIQDESLIEVVSVEAAPVPLENLSTEEVDPKR
jgi:signal peptidase II